MIKEISHIEEVLEFAYEMSIDNRYASYPRILEKEKVRNELEKSLLKTNNVLLAYYEENRLLAICQYFYIEDEKYSQTVFLLVKGQHEKVIDSFIDYIGQELKGYDLLIGLPSGNEKTIKYFRDRKIPSDEESMVTKLVGLNGLAYKKVKEISEIKRENFECYRSFHDKYALPRDIYYKSENLYREIDKFRILVFKDQDEIRASIFFHGSKEIAEVYGIFLDEKYRKQELIESLLDQMLRELSREFGRVEEVVYFIDKGDDVELRGAMKIGFDLVEEYEMYRLKL